LVKQGSALRPVDPTSPSIACISGTHWSTKALLRAGMVGATRCEGHARPFARSVAALHGATSALLTRATEPGTPVRREAAYGIAADKLLTGGYGLHSMTTAPGSSARMWLEMLQELHKLAGSEPGPDDIPFPSVPVPEGVDLPPGVAPEAIADERARAEYEQALERNAQRLQRGRRYFEMQRLLEEFQPLAMRYLTAPSPSHHRTCRH
jgi:hypothetical protein